MSIAVVHGHDAHVIGLEDAGHAGPPSKRIITGYGFWIFLLSDIVMFSCFFAAYAVLSGQTAGGPSGAELFNLRNVAIETAFLLLSSFACGMASIAAEVRSHLWFQIAQLVVSIRHREELRDRTGDPWDGRSLEWATASPPPVFNFAVMPDVSGEDAYWGMKLRAKQQGLENREPDYKDIEMPRNSPTGFVCAFFATIMGFALIWHIWWMVAAGAVGAFATFVAFAWRDHDEYVIPAAEVARIDHANLEERRAALSLAGST